MPKKPGSPVAGSKNAANAAAGLLRSRLQLLKKAIKTLAKSKSGTPRARPVHAVRVSTRRMAVAVDAFKDLLGQKRSRRASRLVRAIRKACGDARDCDVLIAWVSNEKRTSSARSNKGLEMLAEELRHQRRAARRRLSEDLPRLASKVEGRLAEWCDLEDQPPSTAEFAKVAKHALERSADRVLAAASADLEDDERLHELRIACKRLRYGIELFQSVLGKPVAKSLLLPLTTFQEHLGGFTDASVRTRFLEGFLAKHPTTDRDRLSPGNERLDQLTEIRQTLRSERASLRRGRREAIKAWRAIESEGFVDALRRAILGLGQERAAAKQGESAPSSSPPRPLTEVSPVLSEVGSALPSQRRNAAKRRLAAIDIGTNSIRLIVAETAPDGSYRVLDDEKEITRLGRGMHKSGRLEAATQEHSAVTIARMKSIAQGYGADEIRVVATAACREAKNGADFVSLVKEKSGLQIEIIGEEEEALLAYRSAAGAFHLSGIPAAVVDIGGGSLELVLSAGTGQGDSRGAGLGGGVIERVHSLPLGAVRLTEQFGGEDRASGKRFDEMVRFIRKQLRKSVGKLPLTPQIVVGTGGTFTTLAAMLSQKELGPNASGLVSGAVQGREVRRSDLRHALEYLRKLGLKERSRVPGVPTDRADIIVAGLTVIDELLGFLGANSVFVHEGGIRDGLLLSMVRGVHTDEPSLAVSPIRGVKRFAKTCNFEAAHARHVTRLALQVFDQLAPHAERLRGTHLSAELALTPRDRLILEAASLLHDVGYLVNYASHHKHSYHLIVHAELPGFTSHEIQVIANVARYHRAAEPKMSHQNFATLSEEDQNRVRALAAILRVVDGLDRTHMQQVQDVGVEVIGDAAAFTVRSSVEPAVDIWGAARKSRLFTRTFGLAVGIEWRNALTIPA